MVARRAVVFWAFSLLCGCGESASDGEAGGDGGGEPEPSFHQIDAIAEHVAQASADPQAQLDVSIIDVTADGRVAAGTSNLLVLANGTIERHGVAFRWTAKTGTVALGELPGGTPLVEPTYTLAMTPDGSVLVG